MAQNSATTAASHRLLAAIEARPIGDVVAGIVAAITGNRPAVLALSLALIIVIALADFYTPFEFRLAILYLLPVFLATWHGGRKSGLLMAATATAIWIVSFHSHNTYWNQLYFYWEAAVLGGTLSLFAFLVARLHLAIQHADERFATVLEGLDAVVYATVPEDGRILYANQRFTDLFGASDKGRMRENEAGLSAAWEPAPAVIANGISSDPSNGEFQHRASKRWYHVNENSIRWIDGRMVSLKVATDITEAKRAQELNLRRQTKLQANSRLMTAGGMASVLAHELNQPLTAISIYSRHCVQLLSPGHADTAGLRDTLEKCPCPSHARKRDHRQHPRTGQETRSEA